MKSLFYLFIILCSLLIAFSCHTIKTIAPPHTTEAPEIILKHSTISVPIALDVKDIETRINKDFNGLIYQDDNLQYSSSLNLMIKAWKLDSIKISFNGNELSYSVPLKIWIKYNVNIVKFGFKVSDSRELSGYITLNFKTAISINRDWSISTRTNTDGYKWISTPAINIAGIDLPMTTFIGDLILKTSKDRINREIDKTINKNVNLRKYVENAWTLLQKPLKVYDEYNVWFKIAPYSIATVPISGNNKKIYISLAISSINQVFIGKEPSLSEAIPLPELNIVSKLDPSFSVNINTDIPFTKINELAQKQITGKIITQGRRKIQIMNLNIYGSTDHFIVDVSVTGSLKGNIFLTGKPVYNSTTKTIEIKDLDFNLNTKNALAKSANWLLHSTFIKMIEPKLNYSIADRIDESRSIIQKYIKNNKSIKGMTLNGDLKNIDIDSIYVTDETLKAVINLEGVLIVDIDGLSKM